MIRHDIFQAPNRSGIYIMYSGETCIYVGSSQCLRLRLLSHKYRRLADGWQWQMLPVGQLIAEEQRLIDELKPTMNRAKAYRPPRKFQRPSLKVQLHPLIFNAIDKRAQMGLCTRNIIVQTAIREYLQRNDCWPKFEHDNAAYILEGEKLNEALETPPKEKPQT